MSALTKLSALRMQERQLLALRCHHCGHALGVHSLWANTCSGDLGGKGCRCVLWRDPEEQLEIR